MDKKGFTSYTPEAYAEKKEARAERFRARAEKARTESRKMYEAAHKMAEVIPFGQPILIGHHSEKRDRNYRGKIDGKFSKASELQDKAKYYAEKAEAAEDDHAISSDDPEAIAKLEKKLANLEASRDLMKRANAHYRKHGNLDTLEGLSDTAKKKAIESKWSFSNNIFELTTTGANIRSVKERIERLKKLAEAAEQSGGNKSFEFPGGSFVANYDINRYQFFFDSIPDADTRAMLKSHGFKFSKYNDNAWQRQMTGNALYWCKVVLKQLRGEKPDYYNGGTK